MNSPAELQNVLAVGRAVRQVCEDIYSVLPDEPRAHLYDRRARAYDLIVSTWPYNRVMWGTAPSDYEAFARRAVSSRESGRLLDAGCGSLLFTARAHTGAPRPVVAFDQSLRMLERARARLLKLAGRVPRHVTLLQADISDLPFRPASFGTVLCMNVLHHYADGAGLVGGLASLVEEGGDIFLTSLARSGRFVGDRYLDALFRAGDFARPRTVEELKRLFDSSPARAVELVARGNMVYATARIF